VSPSFRRQDQDPVEHGNFHVLGFHAGQIRLDDDFLFRLLDIYARAPRLHGARNLLERLREELAEQVFQLLPERLHQRNVPPTPWNQGSHGTPPQSA